MCARGGQGVGSTARNLKLDTEPTPTNYALPCSQVQRDLTRPKRLFNHSHGKLGAFGKHDVAQSGQLVFILARPLRTQPVWELRLLRRVPWELTLRLPSRDGLQASSLQKQVRNKLNTCQLMLKHNLIATLPSHC